MRIGIVVPHIFMHQDILPKVIFSPGTLALDLADGLQALGAEVTLFTPGPVPTAATNTTADLSYFEAELAGRGDSYIDLLKKHPVTFITLARQVQSELIAKAFAMANNDQLDVVHIYTNEEDIALPFAALCSKPVVLTHHDPFNFSVKYKNVFPKYKTLNWLSISLAQRKGMPEGTNWLANIYHGLRADELHIQDADAAEPYIAYLGRIIQPKGVHLAIAAVKAHNARSSTKYKLKIAGKHYADASKDNYWQQHIAPLLDDDIQYVGFVKTTAEKQAFLGNASALIIPSIFEEPFGMVMIEALACGTPLVGLDSGAIPEVITPTTGVLVHKHYVSTGQHVSTSSRTPTSSRTRSGIQSQKDTLDDTARHPDMARHSDAVRHSGLDPESSKTPKPALDEAQVIADLATAIDVTRHISRQACRQDFEARFTLTRMCSEHLAAYQKLHARHSGLDPTSFRT